MAEYKEGSLVHIWRRIAAPDTLAPYMRICAALKIGVEERGRPMMPEPKVRLVTWDRDTPANIGELKDAIADHVSKTGIYLSSVIAPNDLLPVGPALRHQRRDDTNADEFDRDWANILHARREQWAAGARLRVIEDYMGVNSRWW